MNKLASVIDAEIARRLAAVRAPGEPCAIEAEELRAWAIEYIADHENDVGHDSEEAALPHWNLWMNDADYEDAVFAVIVFRPDAMEFFCGSGDSSDIRCFDGPDDIDGLFAAAQAEFDVPDEPLRLSRTAAVAWLGRDW